MMSTLIALTFNGASYGIILFLLASGLTVTLGLMRIINLAHCGFGMIGGYLALGLVGGGFGMVVAVPVAVAGTMLIGGILERTVYQWVYRSNDLGQILMTVGLVFMMVASVNFIFGSNLRTLPIPVGLSTNLNILGASLQIYRMFLVCLTLGLTAALWWVTSRTRFGAQLRASVDNRDMALCSGIDVKRLYTATFCVGCGLAAIGGILGTFLMPLEPYYAVKYMILVLVVVAIGGLGSLMGSFIAALLVGIVSTFASYFLHSFGGLILYVFVIPLLLVRPNGLLGRAS